MAAMLVGTMQVTAADPPQSQKQADSAQKPKCTDLSGQPIACPETADQPPKAGRDSSGDWSLEKSLPKNLVLDQKDFWTSPLRFRTHDLTWAVPFAGATAGLLATDTDIEKHLPSNPNTIKRAQDFSKYGVVGFTGLVGGSYLWGRFTHNDHLRRTGLLSGEAAVGTLVSTLPIKLVTGRDRPLEGDGTGKFWQGHLSFPSEHSAAAWSIASVFAHEYPSLPVQALAYSAATAMTASRVIGRKHWSSDAFVGSALGWYFGRQVYKRHEESEFADQQYGSFLPARNAEGVRNPSNMGSPYVPLDSWVYPAFDRLAALGYVQSGFMGMRPWTRFECARLLAEAESNLSQDQDGDADAILRALDTEFAADAAFHDAGSGAEAGVDSVYARVINIAGTPLRDGYHFGQTIVNDYGRPFSQGTNLISGITTHATAGPLTFFVRGEYQHSPFSPSLPLTAREAIAQADGLPQIPNPTFETTNRVRLLDSYIAFTFANNQFSFGKQSYWWGPSQGGSMNFSDNAEPVTMFRLSRTNPFVMPSIMKWLGPIKTEFFWGQLVGYQYIFLQQGAVKLGPPVRPQPYIHGEKISLKPTPNLEIGFSETTVFGGPGFPLTLHNFLRSYSISNTVPGLPDDPGDRRAGFDFCYRVPGLRNRLVLYSDSIAEDEFSPIAYPRRSAWNPGVYIPRFPGLEKLELRVEGAYTNLPNLNASGVYYFNTHYVSGYTNNGNIMGHWVGRDGSAVQGWATYWLSARNRVQFGYRENKISNGFLPGGGTSKDFKIKAELFPNTTVGISAFVQYETWNIPSLSPVPNHNLVSSLQLTFWPKLKIGSHGHGR